MLLQQQHKIKIETGKKAPQIIHMHIKFKKCCLRAVEENFKEFSQNAEQKNKEKLWKQRKIEMPLRVRDGRQRILYTSNRSIQKSRVEIFDEIIVENCLKSNKDTDFSNHKYTAHPEQDKYRWFMPLSCCILLNCGCLPPLSHLLFRWKIVPFVGNMLSFHGICKESLFISKFQRRLLFSWCTSPGVGACLPLPAI